MVDPEQTEPDPIAEKVASLAKLVYQALALGLVFTVAVAAFVFVTSYEIRKSQSEQIQAGCVRTSKKTAANVNNLRSDLAVLVSVPQTAPVRTNVLAKQAEIQVDDAQVDPSVRPLLTDAWDQRASADSRFSCAKSYPIPGIFAAFQ